MNATRAATIRLRSSFDGAVSLGRVQTPTLAIIARREEEIRAFKPEPYWLVDAQFEATGARRYAGRYHGGKRHRRRSRGATRSSQAVEGQPGEITKLEKKEERERAPLLYDLTSLQRDANTRYGFSAAPHARARRSALRGAQGAHLPAHELALPDRATWSPRSSRPPSCVGRAPEYAQGRRVRDRARRAAARARGQRREGHRPPRDHPHQLRARPRPKMSARRAEDLRPGRARFLAVFHPRPCSRTRASRPRSSTSTSSAPAAACCSCRAGAASTARRPTSRAPGRGRRGRRPAAAQARAGRGGRHTRSSRLRKETKPPRRYTDASLLGAMETAGKLVDDDELREAMKDSGIGTPGHARGDHRAPDRRRLSTRARGWSCTEKGLNVIRLLDEHPLTSPELTGDWEHRLADIEQGEESRREVHGRHRQVRRRDRRADRQARQEFARHIELRSCPRCGAETGEIIRENSKAYGCTSWKSREEMGCGFVIWKRVAGRTLTPSCAPAARGGQDRGGRSRAFGHVPANLFARASS